MKTWNKINSWMTINQNKIYLSLFGIFVVGLIVAGVLESQREIITITITK
jgi:hypothetical protein